MLKNNLTLGLRIWTNLWSWLSDDSLMIFIWLFDDRWLKILLQFPEDFLMSSWWLIILMIPSGFFNNSQAILRQFYYNSECSSFVFCSIKTTYFWDRTDRHSFILLSKILEQGLWPSRSDLVLIHYLPIWWLPLVLFNHLVEEGSAKRQAYLPTKSRPAPLTILFLAYFSL